MASNIPDVGDFGTLFLQGAQTGSNIMNQLMEQARLRQQMEQQQQQQQQEFGLKKELQPLNLKLLRAKIQEAQRSGTEPLSNYGKVLTDVERIRNQYGEESSQYKSAKEYADRLAQGNGMQLDIDPKTGAISFSQGTRGGRTTGQLVNGQYVTTPTQATLSSQQKSNLANVAREVGFEWSDHPYQGTGSNLKLISDRQAYTQEKDPTKKKELGDNLFKAALAEKLIPELVPLQLASQGIPATVNAINNAQQSLKQGWAEALPTIANNLPSDLQKRVNQEYLKVSNLINKKKAQYLAKGMPIELNDNQEKETKNTVILMGPNGETAEGPEENADAFLKANPGWRKQ